MQPVKKYKLINGDLLKSTAKYIAHQTNCKTDKAKGVAEAIFAKYPYANIYGDGTERVPGKIIIRGNGLEQRYVINMVAQFGPGKPNKTNDSSALRFQWFKQCLKQIDAIENLESVAFPYLIGCGLAGGLWEEYQAAINSFAGDIKAEVLLYKI